MPSHTPFMRNLKVTTALLLMLLSVRSLLAQEPTFQEFLQQFPKATLPYSFDTAALKDQIETGVPVKVKRLDWSYYQFLPELERSAQFSSKPVHPEPVAVFETDDFYAVLYNIARGLTRGTKTYSITIFDKNGAYVGTHFIAGVDKQHLTTATIDEQLNARIEGFNISWERPSRYDEAPSPKISDLEPSNIEVLELTAPGNPDPVEWTSTAKPARWMESEMSADIAKMK